MIQQSGAEGSDQRWWQRPDAFAVFGKKQLLRIEQCEYLGGWEGITEGHGGNGLEVSAAGLCYGYPGIVSIRVPWDRVDRMAVTGREQAYRPRVTVGRAAGKWATSPIGLYSLLVKEKSAQILIGTYGGEEGAFQTAAHSAQDLRGILAPVLRHYPDPESRAAVSDAASRAPATSTGPSLADQIRELAELHKAGVLTDEEFSAKKGELLARM